MTKIKDIREKLNTIGKQAEKDYLQVGNLESGKLAVKAYSEMTRTATAQVRYNEGFDSQARISFLEE